MGRELAPDDVCVVISSYRARTLRLSIPRPPIDGEAIGDSDTIIAHLIRKYRLAIDAGLTAAQRDTDHLITRMLDDLYWVMSYSRWKDAQFWPAFRDALRREHPSFTKEGLVKAQEFNSQRYCYQGIGRFARLLPNTRGLADLRVLANLVPANRYLHGAKPASTPASTASSPIFISTRSIRRSSNLSPRTPISLAIAPRSTRLSGRLPNMWRPYPAHDQSGRVDIDVRIQSRRKCSGAALNRRHVLPATPTRSCPAACWSRRTRPGSPAALR
jgi:hypothetical protein